MPQIAAVGLVGGFREDGAIGAPEEPAGFQRKLKAWSVLRYSGPVKLENGLATSGLCYRQAKQQASRRDRP